MLLKQINEYNNYNVNGIDNNFMEGDNYKEYKVLNYMKSEA